MFRLLRYFSLTSGLAVLVISVLLAVVQRWHEVNHLIEIVEEQNVALARSFANAVWPRFSSYVASVSELDGDALRARPETREIHETLKKLTTGLPVLKVKIYNPEGLTVYSSQPGQMGVVETDSPGFIAVVRQGNPASKLTYRDTFSAFSGEVWNRDLVETYVPIRPGNGPIEGVLELYTDVTSVLALIRSGTIEMVAAIIMAFGLLYAALFLIVRRADRALKRQHADLGSEVAERKRAEEELRESEARMRDLVECSSDWIWHMDADLRFSHFSDNFTEVTGIRPEEILGRTRLELGQGDIDDEKWRRHLADLEARQPFRDFRYKFAHRNGRTLHFMVNGKPVFDEAGAFRGYRGVASDITVQVKAEEQARSAGERLALAVDGLSELFALFDADDRIVLTNAAWRELNRKVIDTAGPGASFEDHLRAAIQAGLLPEAVGREEEWLRRRMDRHRNPKGPFEVERQDGRWLLVNEQRLPDGGTVLILTDITERKRAEEALREAERRFRNLVEGSVQGILIHQDRRPVYVNQAWAEIHGYTVDEVLAMESVIPLIAPDDRPRMDEFRKLRMEGGEAPSHYEYEAIKKDGSRICLENMATVVEWKDEPAIQSTIVDITERKRAEEALRESEARFRAVLDNSPAKIHIKDLDGRYTLINRRSELLFGVTDEEARGKTSRDIFPKKVADAFAGHDQKVIESGQSIEEEEKWVSDDGLRTYLTVKFPIRDADGEIVAVGAIGTDITEHKRAELVIRESWEFLRGAVNSLQEGFALFDADDRLILINGEYERVNPSAPEMLEQGLRYEDVLRANVERGMIAEAIGREEEFIRERLERHRDPRGTILRHFTDGKWCLIREARTPDGGTTLTFTDVTELKRTEEALLQAKQQNDMILEAAGEGIYGLDLQGRTTFINPAAAKMVGWELEDLIGLPQHDIVHHTKPDGSSYPREECPIYAAFKDGKRHHVTDEVFWKKDGTTFPVEYVSTPIRVEGELIGAVVVFRDITERMQAEEKLRESEEQLRLSLAAARIGTFCWNIQEDTNFWDDRMHEIWGLEPGTYTSTATKDFFANVHPEDAEWVNQAVARTINDDAEHNIEYRIVRPDQSIAYVHELAAVVRDDRKRPLRLIGVCLDVTGRKRAEEEKAALEREVQQAGRTEAIGLLAGGIAHEINTPIQYIRDNLRFLDDAWGDIGTVVKKYRMLAQAARDKGVLESEVRKADSAADEADLEYLLDEFSKATRQSIEGTGRVADIVLAMKEFSHPSMKEKVATNINRAIKSTLTVSRNEWKHVAEVDFDLDETLAPVICLAGEVNQVFLNLIINAAHAIAAKGGDGKERITISTRKDGDWVEIRVADTGTGIPEDMRDKIFNPFFTTKEVGKGTGQGLAICHDIVTNKHGGKIFFETEMGKGTTFVVRLPLDAQEKASEAA